MANGNGGFASHSTRRPTTLPRIGIMKASNRHVVREFKPSKKKVLRRKRKLTRDRYPRRPSMAHLSAMMDSVTMVVVVVVVVKAGHPGRAGKGVG